MHLLLFLFYFFSMYIKTVLKCDRATVEKAEKFGILFIAYVQFIFQNVTAPSVKTLLVLP